MNRLVSTPSWHNSIGVYQAKQTGLNVTESAPRTVDNTRAAPTQAEKDAAEAARLLAITVAQTASANDYHATLAKYSGVVSDADSALCSLNVNPFNQAQVNAMKACLQAKVPVVPTPTPTTPAPTVPSDGGGGGEAGPTAPDSKIVSDAVFMGFSWTQIGIVSVVVLLLAVAGYYGYKHYKKDKAKQ